MLIKCENCSAEYEVSEKRLNAQHPHFLKCSACGFVFQTPVAGDVEQETNVPAVEQTDAVPMALSDIFTPQEQEQEVVSLSNEEEKPPEESVEKTQSDENASNLFAPLGDDDEFAPVKDTKHSVFGRILLSFLAFVLTFAAVVYLLYVGRYFFTRKAPNLEQLYQKAGISTQVLGEGLAFQNTLFDIAPNANDDELIVKSQIINTTAQTKIVPDVVVLLLDESGAIIQKQSVDLLNADIEAGETLPFETRILNLTEKARRVEITFEKDTNP